MKTIEKQLYTLDELTDDARRNAYNEWIESVLPFDVYDHLSITVDYDARKALETVGADWDCDTYGNMWPIMRRVEIPRDGHANKMEDSGDWVSMDMAEAFNAHGPKMEEYAGMWYKIAYPEDNTPFWDCDDESSYALLGMYEQLYLEEYEKAAYDALRKWKENREAEEEYLTSFEAFADECAQGYECYTCEYPYYKNGGYKGRVYYSDCRKWYTVEGEFFDQSNINHACISIVKAG